MLEIKTTVIKMEMPIMGSSVDYTAEEKKSGSLKIETSKSEMQRERKRKKSRTWDNFKGRNMYVIEIRRRK